jgi:hypothetical protein
MFYWLLLGNELVEKVSKATVELLLVSPCHGVAYEDVEVMLHHYRPLP